MYTYERIPGTPPVSVMRLPAEDWPVGESGSDHAHAHDFLVLAYFERGGGSLRLAGRTWPVAAGDVFLIAPGEVVAVHDGEGLSRARAWLVFFPVEVLAPGAPDAFPSWRSHPLLFAFLGHTAGAAQRLRVPEGERPRWSERIAAMQRELLERRDGCEEAVIAHLTLLLVSISRLVADVGDHHRLSDEPLLAAVFEAIEANYDARISLTDIAEAVGLTPGHLTTVVRRKTGRTVQQWIAERRMTKARKLLDETDLTVNAIAAQAGYGNPSYFIKQFKRAHTVTPLVWRRAGRIPAESRRQPAARA